MYTRKKCELGVMLSVLEASDRCQALVVAGIKVMCAAVCICAGELVARLVVISYIYVFVVVAHTLVLI